MTPDPARAVSYEHLFATFLEAYRAGEPIEDVKVSVAGGKSLRPADVLIISPDKTTHHGWVTTRTHAHEQYANEVKAKAESTPQLTPGIYDNTAPLLCVSAEVAYEAMMDALRDKIDPQMVEVKTNGGHVRPHPAMRPYPRRRRRSDERFRAWSGSQHGIT